jgi:hypothetical protein
MAWVVDVQYYDAKFVADETNMVYHNLVNCVLTKPPYFNNSFRTIFTQGTDESWDKKQFFVDKREGFTKLKRYYNGVEETDNDWNFRDIKVLNWARYFFAIKNDYKFCRLYKQVKVNDLSPCDNSCLNAIDEWHIERLMEFPFSKCLFDKMILTTWPRWKTKHAGTTWTVRIQLLQDTYFSSIYDSSPIKADWWDYVFIHWFESPVDWYFLQIWWDAWNLPIDWLGTNPNTLYVDWTWAPWLELKWTATERANISYKIFEEYWLILTFVTDDWIVTWHYDEWTNATSEYTIVWWTKKAISSYCTFWDSFAFMDNATWILWVSDIWYNKFHYTISSAYPSHWQYTSMAERQWILVLLWPENIWYFLYEETTHLWQITEATALNWYYSKDSWCLFDEKFFMVRKTQDFYKL